MKAAVTSGVGTMEVLDVAEPGEPAPGHVLVRNEAVGICGSDYHFLLGELSESAGGGASPFPKIQGHECGGTIAAIGAGCRPELEVSSRVAMYPLHACGNCYPCSVGRPNTCDNFTLIGIHLDGGLQEYLQVPEEQIFPIDTADAAVAALAEPVSIAVRAVHRANVASGEHVVVMGAGPIGQCVCLLARERGAEVMVVDLQRSRLDMSRDMGAEGLVWTDAPSVIAAARDWAGGGGPAVVFDATGAAPAVGAMLEIVASAGRAVQVGMSNHDVAVRVGLLTEKEIDLLGSSCCGGGDFAEAVGAVERNAELLAGMISHEFPLERAPEAIQFAIDHPAEVMKVVIRV
ncbi:MAG TPA: alcohol dehydrogenase catalytic domain-containing protein [Solirubrobacteraceae bacterium]